jgi:hypothetical protein
VGRPARSPVAASQMPARTSGAPSQNASAGSSSSSSQARIVAPTGSVRMATATTVALTLASRPLKTVCPSSWGPATIAASASQAPARYPPRAAPLSRQAGSSTAAATPYTVAA